MASHTGGDWSIMTDNDEGFYIVDETDAGALSRVAHVLFHDDSPGETLANARLISATPMLFAALEAATKRLWQLDEMIPSTPLRSANHKANRDAIQKASAAIAKARGEQVAR